MAIVRGFGRDNRARCRTLGPGAAFGAGPDLSSRQPYSYELCAGGPLLSRRRGGGRPAASNGRGRLTVFVESHGFRPEHFVPIRGRSPRPCDAVAALLVHEDGRYIMQLRDGKPGIFYPAHWGCFGGAVDTGETPVDALRRELREEIQLDMPAATRFTQFDFDFSALGYSKVYRIYFEVKLPNAVFERFVLREGQDVQAFRGEDLLVTRRVAPYDAFAVWMHMSRERSLSNR